MRMPVKISLSLITLSVFGFLIFGRREPLASKYRSDDLGSLLPSFRAKVTYLLYRMRARGFNPVVVDAVRTPAEAAQNAAAGTGIVDSLHLYGAAVDIIDAQFGRNYPTFFTALGEESGALGLTWGGNFSNRDIAHVQAVSVAQQNQFRARASREAREAFLRANV